MSGSSFSLFQTVMSPVERWSEINQNFFKRELGTRFVSFAFGFPSTVVSTTFHTLSLITYRAPGAAIKAVFRIENSLENFSGAHLKQAAKKTAFFALAIFVSLGLSLVSPNRLLNWCYEHGLLATERPTPPVETKSGSSSTGTRIPPPPNRPAPRVPTPEELEVIKQTDPDTLRAAMVAYKEKQEEEVIARVLSERLVGDTKQRKRLSMSLFQMANEVGADKLLENLNEMSSLPDPSIPNPPPAAKKTAPSTGSIPELPAAKKTAPPAGPKKGNVGRRAAKKGGGQAKQGHGKKAGNVQGNFEIREPNYDTPAKNSSSPQAAPSSSTSSDTASPSLNLEEKKRLFHQRLATGDTLSPAAYKQLRRECGLPPATEEEVRKDLKLSTANDW